MTTLQAISQGGEMKVLENPGLPARIWDKISFVAPTGCWEWTGDKRHGGYGRARLCGEQRAVHRIVYEAFVGAIPEGLQLDHLCRVTHCVNPAHLEAVTQQENIIRSRGRPETHCRNGHEFTPENTYQHPGKFRRCRICQRAAEARAEAKKRPLGQEERK